MLPNHAFPGGDVTATKDDERVCIWNRGNDSVQVFMNLIFDLIWVGHIGGIGSGKSGELFPRETRSLIVIGRSFTPFRGPASMTSNVALTATKLQPHISLQVRLHSKRSCSLCLFFRALRRLLAWSRLGQQCRCCFWRLHEFCDKCSASLWSYRVAPVKNGANVPCGKIHRCCSC